MIMLGRYCIYSAVCAREFIFGNLYLKYVTMYLSSNAEYEAYAIKFRE